ncbi:cation:proton antiporter domain-containing protein [Plantactinospora soyae]|uniref:Kef-type K+ transport system membrane component KefB n=1 Tax=Plantactinospora soyae TaxID=1544732 RepID=A0A927M9T1_9ACTN|nr:cation:proton antiporter [Plantactinospora soyae]MBE1489732.1 Kef-type K+ transport system membrane component KefB [Plantactinospora soyae]
MVRTKQRLGLRAVGVYGLLVVLPVLISVVLLTREGGAGGGATKAAAAGHPLAQLLLAIAVVIAACRLAGWLMRRIGQPAVVGEIIAGVVLGPSLLGAVWPAGAAALLPDAILPQLNVLAQVGVVLFVFLTGLELNTRLIRGRGHLAVVVSHVSIAVPFVLGVLLAIVAYAKFAPEGVGPLAFALFIGVSMSITALPVLARILKDTGMFHSRVGVVVLTCAVIDDVTAWSLLALVVAVVTASSLVGVLLTLGSAVAFAALLLYAIRPLMTLYFARTPDPTLRRLAPLALVGVLLCAMATEWIGVHAMFGAFMFGLVFPRGNVVERWLHQNASGLTTVLMLPLFFAYSGLRTNLTLLADASQWLWCAVILVVAVVGKLVSAAVAARSVGESLPRALQIGVLMNCRGLTELIVLNVGLDLGVLSPTIFTMLVLMALISTAMTAPLAVVLDKRASRHKAALASVQQQPAVAMSRATPAGAEEHDAVTDR